VDGYRAARGRRRRLLIWLLALGGVATATTAWAVGGLAAVVVAVAVLVVAALMPRGDADRWLRGAAGERATAQLLHRLPPRRWTVFHDLAVPGSRANIDHLVIGRTGVWVVDTKTTRAPIGTRWRAVYFGDRRLDPAPVEWEAEIVSDRLEVAARPVIAVHGSLIRPARAGRVRVVSATELPRRLRRGRRRLSRNEVAALSERAAVVFHGASARG
jgi:hypothetical protein